MTLKKGATIWARQTIESDIFFWKPDKWFKIWFFLVNEANYADTKQFKRGECFITYGEIMHATKASKDQVDKFMRWIKNQKMATTRKTTRGMVITLSKYSQFQDSIKIKSDTQDDSKAKQKRNKSDTIQKKTKNTKQINNNNILQPQASAEQIKKLFEVFQMTVNPTINYGNTTQRKAAQQLIDDIGEEKALRLARYACSIQTQDFAPTVTTPYQLREKAAQIRLHWQKNNNKQGNVTFIS